MMKTKPLDEPLQLNLYNFDDNSARNCPYVLTSPRSLEACRKAGCKPVELLRKSVEEYREELGLSSDEVYKLYIVQERERLNKLEICRAIRNSLLMCSNRGQMKENYPPFDVSSDISRIPEGSPKEVQLNKETNSKARKQASEVRHNKKQGNKIKSVQSKTHSYQNHIKHRVSHGVTTSAEDRYGSSAATSTAPSPTVSVRKRHTYLTAGGLCGNHLSRYVVTNDRSGPEIYQPSTTETSASSISSGDSPTVSGKRTKHCGSNRHRSPCGKTKQKLCWPVPSPYSDKEQTKSLSQIWNSEDKNQGLCCKLRSSYDSNNNSSGDTNISTLACYSNPWKIDSFSSENLHIPEHDRRILMSMAFKKEMERASDQFAHQAHLLWERDREEREQYTNEQAQFQKELLAEKRRIESAENARKLEETKLSLRKSQLRLERSIMEKEERAAMRKKIAEERKMSGISERSLSAARHRSEIEAAHRQMETEMLIWQQTLDQKQKERLQKAEDTRLHHRETYRRRVASANRVEELRHQERWQQVREETEAALRELRQHCRAREQRAQEKYDKMLQERDRQIKGQSLERAIKFQQVRQLHDDLERGFEKWQKQVKTLQCEATQKAEHRATRQVESKRQRVETENRARQRHHTRLMERINREDEARIQYIREVIARKEAKMKQMAEERDLAIRESRRQAQATADLREHLRCTLSPETFDRKVARVTLEARVTARPPTASPPLTRSHIFLG
ncbi:coiled-coil domain-containing protein 177 isoform X1 [Schistocerca americana]|uniref:coiled-coil domain-containing protein 177 isoform X1 n=2 Tax=Schistocerca americana TaxID=7009 RepID=UPI001F4FC166|nr:coiled-coil domain-containing protein 177 isoform X1 [Schistocerca americana]XP_046985685.1 coiled-coil domain-containing protein 177 isoform X1 [Schistocerca americana]XP_046985686.1 coiled-coil domain-containing protein 177 isoform X1 [Schistocerca americana]XP_046985687.1 coiled-coil domain-containing protein 177 isoform X1 [Schistocerca americana]XP_046985688.1 coiled-coil domain-containing protein 177 isoform X1 [Schistocerca americana]XP_046985689.1 coiled-coil domain-containing prote